MTNTGWKWFLLHFHSCLLSDQTKLAKSVSDPGLMRNQAILSTGQPDCRHVKYGKMWNAIHHIAIIFLRSLNFGGEECTVPFVTYQHSGESCSFKRKLGNASISLVIHFVSASKNKKCECVNFTSEFTSSANKWKVSTLQAEQPWWENPKSSSKAE